MAGSSDDLVDEMMREGQASRRAADLRRAEERKAEAKLPKSMIRATPEMDAQKSVVRWLRLAGCLVSATQNERGAKSKDEGAQARFGAMRKASGVTAGFPDLTLCTPGGRVCFVEMKSSVGRLSQAQLAIHAWLQAHGHVVVTGTSIDTVQDALRREGIVISRNADRMRMAVPVEPLR